MSTLPMNFAAKRHARGLPFVFRPLDEWSRRRTVCVALAVGLLVFTAGLRAWRMSDASQLDASRAAWRRRRRNRYRPAA